MQASSSCQLQELHIAGLIVQARPAQALPVAAALAALSGVEVRAAGPAGKLVVVCECLGEAVLVETIGRMRDLPGVLGVTPVYQHAEPARAMDEEIDDEADAS